MVWAAAGLAVAAVIGLFFASGDAPAHRVTHVYDGDTIEVAGVGKVRLIGVDAMDGVNQKRTASQSAYYEMAPERVRHWAERATQFTRERLEGKEVLLRYGPEVTDRYGRVLAYVHLAQAREGGEEVDFNLLLIRKGLAAAYRRFSHPRRAEYVLAEGRASAECTGMWADIGH